MTKILNRPKISLNKLGEYMSKNAARQEQILKDQKYPKEFITTRYSIARELIRKFYAGEKTTDELKAELERLISIELRFLDTSFKKSNHELTIEALEQFIKSDQLKNLANEVKNESCETGYRPEIHVGVTHKVEIEGVEISINPDIIFRGTYKKKPFVGAIKLHFSKTNSLDEKSGKYISGLMHHYLKGNYDKSLIRHQFCIVVDVLRDKYYCAPTFTSRVFKDIQAACRQVKATWNTI